MANFTLDDIRAAAERKYANTEIQVSETDTVVLVNALQLTKQKRADLMATQDRLEEDGADQEELLKDALRLVSKNDHQADVLLDAIGDNMAVLVEVFGKYSGETEAGEA